jgi:hypothetical protein
MSSQPRPTYGLPGAGHDRGQAARSGLKTCGLKAPARTRRCSSRSTVSSGATPSSSLVDISRRSTAASPTPAPAANVAFIPPATGPARASRTPTSTSKEAHALLSMLALRGKWCWLVLRIALTYKLEGWYWAISMIGPSWIHVSTLVSTCSFTTSSFCPK